MKRFQLAELEDLSWFPHRIRNYMTDFLRTVSVKMNLFGPAVPIIAAVLRKQQNKQIVDLASGGGGQWETLLTKITESCPDVSLTLTDYYPNSIALSHLKDKFGDRVSIQQSSVDARSVPEQLEGLRTMFLSLHHFTPEDATAILKNAVDSNEPIAVFEAQQRDIKHVIQFSLSPIMVLILTPFIKPLSFLRLLFTYLLPVVPISVGIDGVISVLRTYTVDEMKQMAAEADPEKKFQWRAEVLTHGYQKIQYLTGTPTSTSE